MPAGDHPEQDLSIAMLAETARQLRGTVTTDPRVTSLLGFLYHPGDLVVDRVTGQSAKVLHALHYTVVA